MRYLVLVFSFALSSACAPLTPAPPTTVVPPFPPASPLKPLTAVPVATLRPIASLAAPVAATPSPAPAATLAPDLVLFDAALRPDFRGDLNLLHSPTIYRLDLHLDPSLTQLTGQEAVTYTNHAQTPLTEIHFRLFANYPDYQTSAQVSQVNLDGAPVQPAFAQSNTDLKVPLARALPPGSPIRLDLTFSVTIPISGTGHYADLTDTNGIVTLPTVYPLIPEYDEKGWHTELPPSYGDFVYADASLYDVRFTAPATTTVVASGVPVETKTQGADTTWHLIGAPMRDFDLNVSALLTKSSAQVDGVTVNSYYLPQDQAAGQDALRWASAALQDYDRRIGPYPFVKLDVVETPTTAGGIEYPGLVVVAQNLYENPDQRDFFEFATVHEVAHQWFYAQVGDDQVNTPWMDESLAQYCSYIYEQDMKGANAASLVLKRFFEGLYRRAQDQNADKPVGLPVAAYTQDQYDEIVYGKGPLFFDAVRQQIGDDNFFKFLQTYYLRFKYRIAKPEDILNTLDEVSGQKVDALYDQWILGQ